MFCSLIFLWRALDLSLGSWPFAHNVKRRFTEASPGMLSRPKVCTDSAYIRQTMVQELYAFWNFWMYYFGKCQLWIKVLSQAFSECLGIVTSSLWLQHADFDTRAICILQLTRQRHKSEAETGWESLDPGLLPIGGLHISNFNCLTECSDMKILGKQFYNLYLKEAFTEKAEFHEKISQTERGCELDFIPFIQK